MRIILYALLIMCIGICVATTCVNVANAIKPTTLDEAVDRPFKIERYVDLYNGVVCYWNTRHPAYLTCVKVTRPQRRVR